MTRVQLVEHEIKKLGKADLVAFRKWFCKYDAAAWDAQIEKDVRGGKLAKFVREARRAHKAGKTTEL